MAKIEAIRKEHRQTNEPVNVGDKAIDNLRFIRETMERSTHFTAVPGYGGILMGVTAIVAAYIANAQADFRAWQTTWLIEAGLAFVIGLFAMWQKSKISKTSMMSAPAKKFALGFVPPLICGVVLTFALFRLGTDKDIVTGVWLMLYGAAVVCGGMFSVRIVSVMGWVFMLMGTLAFFAPAMYSDWIMAFSFGILHIVFGLIIARRYGG
ncbi:MAG: hypothetical protein M3449_08840 [Acidobacteriota bacterium]|nr:hypothetical protein [Acidobacteriota bacterium]MDQ3491152.1 hypothetical protein [Acidobacteriota bacterium]